MRFFGFVNPRHVFSTLYIRRGIFSVSLSSFDIAIYRGTNYVHLGVSTLLGNLEVRRVAATVEDIRTFIEMVLDRFDPVRSIYFLRYALRFKPDFDGYL